MRLFKQNEIEEALIPSSVPMELLRRAGFSMIVGIAVQPGRERDRPNVGVVGEVAAALHAFKVPLCLLSRAREMCWYGAVAAEVEGAMIGA